MSHKIVPVPHRETAHEYLTIRQVREQQDLERVSPVGEIDLYTAGALRRALADADEVQNLLVDLSQVHFLALIGVQELKLAGARRAAAKRRFVVVAPTAAVQRVLILTEASAELEIYVNSVSALSSLGF
jgi:anti-sigma B factor antagonist